MSTTPALRVRTRVLDDERALVDLLPDDHGLVWLRDGEGMVAWGCAHRVAVGVGPDRLAGVDDALAGLWSAAEVTDDLGLPGGGAIAFVSATFDEDTPGSRVVVPRRIVGRDDERTWLVTIDPIDGRDDDVAAPGSLPAEHAGPPDRVRFAGSSQPDVHYLEAVAAATAEMAEGTLEKVVLARDHAVWSRTAFALRPLVGRLAARFPTCFTFSVEGLVGATPELLVRRRGPHVESVALAGTAARDDDPEIDAKLLAELLASDKMQREHRAAADSVVTALRPFAASIRQHDVEPMRLANVQHLATRVTAELADPSTTVLALAGALHPTAAVGGTPRDLAVDAIRRLEGMDRGRYGAPVGWVAADGDGELGIALRCAELSGARARLFAGAGIVAGSLPEDELLETRMKLRAMQEALA